jgi:hypothetical protein
MKSKPKGKAAVYGALSSKAKQKGKSKAKAGAR